MDKARLLAAIFFCTMINGCLPVVDFRSPVVRGRVLDNGSGQPLVSAAVALQAFPEISTQTDENGDFVLPPKTNYRWCVLIPDACLVLPYQVTVVVSAPGYRPERLQLKPAGSGSDEVYVTPRLDHE